MYESFTDGRTVKGNEIESNFTEIEVEIAFSQKHSWNNQHLLKASSVPIYNKFYSD
jgi:hypothetical protein